MTSETPDVHALAGAYALDALDPLESAAFEGHLESCGACRDEVRSLREAAGFLSDPVAETPPASLRAGVLAGIAQVRPLPPVGDTTAVGDAPAASSPAGDEPAAAAADDELARRRRPAHRWSRGLVAVAAALALVAGGAVVRSVQLGNELDAISAEAARVTAVLTAPDATTTSASVTTGGRAAVVSSASLGTSVLVADGMAPAPAGRTYQVWYLSADGAPVSAGFLPDGDTSAVVLDGDLSTANGVALSVEPEGGSPAPTTTPIVAIPV